MKDLLKERGVHVDTATIYRWVRKFGPEFAKGSFKHKTCRSPTWHMDESHIHVGGKWHYLWQAVDQPATIVTDKAHSYAKVISKTNRWSFPGEEIHQVDRK